MDNEALKNLVNGIGAMCEMAGLLRDNLIKNGFTREEAVTIVRSFITESFSDRGE